jgi:hypothetical protein
MMSELSVQDIDWFRLAAIALPASAKQSGVSAEIKLKSTKNNQIEIDISFPDANYSKEQLESFYNILLKNFEEYGKFMKAQYRLQALYDHAVDEDKVAIELETWKKEISINIQK